jgi:hypothetical protein
MILKKIVHVFIFKICIEMENGSGPMTVFSCLYLMLAYIPCYMLFSYKNDVMANNSVVCKNNLQNPWLIG